MIRHSLPRSAYNKWAEIDLDALRHNLDSLRQKTTAQIMGVVKANAYGHNISLIAPTLFEAGVRLFGVATLGEALYLRALVPQAQMILVLGAQPPQLFAPLIQDDLDFMLHTPSHIPLIEASAEALNKRARVHLKVDTGMGRVGLLPEQFGAALDLLTDTQWIDLRGVCSHLATSDQKPSQYLQQQVQCFQELRSAFHRHPLAQRFEPLFHLANSDAILQHPESHFDLVRPGIALYGYNGFPGAGLKPVLHLHAQITQSRDLPAQAAIGYGCSFVTQRPSRLAVLSIGYADGCNRLLSNQQDVLIQGQAAPIVGRISMDQMVVDLTDTELLGEVGESAVLIGESQGRWITAQDWAEKLDTIPYEILTSLGTRLPRYLRASESRAEQSTEHEEQF